VAQCNRFLDLSGFMLSGKTAVIELLREFEGINVPGFDFEFCLIRVQDGIMDLENALVDNWSPVRSTSAVTRFKKLVRILARQPSRTRIGYNYDLRFNGQFLKLCSEYIENFILAKWDGKWPYAWHDYSSIEILENRILAKLGNRKSFESEIYLAAGDNFIQSTRILLEGILTQNQSKGDSIFCLHNAIEPFNPQKGLRYFSDAKTIHVDRDPRDNYVAIYNHSEEIRKIGAAENIESFIQRFKFLRDQTKIHAFDSSKVLKVQYEDVVLNYDQTLNVIKNFIGPDRINHANPLVHFDPNVSKKYIGHYRSFSDQKAIDRIEKELGEYCNERI
jgi:hypothetical protein